MTQGEGAHGLGKKILALHMLLNKECGDLFPFTRFHCLGATRR